MAKKAPTEPMECQSAHYGDAIPMAPAPTIRAQNPRAIAIAIFRRLGREGTSTIPYQAARSACDDPHTKKRTGGEGVRPCSSRLGRQNKISFYWK
jgi:hypothetical protein